MRWGGQGDGGLQPTTSVRKFARDFGRLKPPQHIMNSSRRDFIRTVLLASGAVMVGWDDVKALTATNTPTKVSSLNFERAHAYFRDRTIRPEFPKPAKKKYDVIVIGAGPAGLAAAWRLRKEGRDVLVLENEPQPGGVMRHPSFEWEGIPYPVGADHFYEFTGTALDFLHDLDLQPITTGTDALVLDRDNLAVDWWNPALAADSPLPAAEREIFRQFAETLRGMPIPQYPLRTAPSSMVHEYDSVRALPMVRDFKSPLLLDALNLYARSTFGAELDDINLYSFLNFYAREVGAGKGLKRLTFPGGMADLSRRAVDVIGHDAFRTNAAAVYVMNYDDGTVDVNFVDVESGEPHTVTARAAMVCLSKRIARAIIPDLPAARMADLRAVRYAPYINITLCCNAPLFKRRAFEYWLADKQGLYTDVVDVRLPSDIATGHFMRTSGKYVYLMSCPRPESERAKLTDAAWLTTYAQRALNAFAEQIPGAREKVEEIHVFAWGHSLVIPSVGSYQRLLTSVSSPFGRIFFGGADNDLAPSINNAVETAIDMAEQVLAVKKK